MKNIISISGGAAALFATIFLACSGGDDRSSTKDTDSITPGPVTEMDRSRYNLNEPDELLHEMQDPIGSGTDTSANSLPTDSLSE